MKKTLSLILAVIMLLGCMSITAFAAENEEVLYSFDFETNPFDNGWTTFDADGDGRDWQTDTSESGENIGIDGGRCAVSKSHEDGVASYDADNWLFTPAIELKTNNKLTWFIGAWDIGWPDTYAVYIGTTAAVEEMTQIYPESGLTNSEEPWTEKTVDIPESYDEQTVYIAFEHKCEGYSWLLLDNVSVTRKLEKDPASGNTEITAEITAADFGYKMVIPTATTLTEANHENVLLGTDGKVSITNIKHPNDKVNVVYTVDLSNGNLTDGTTTINATYKYKQGANEFAAIDGTTKVTVYANKTVTDSFVNVTANKDQWNAAPAGTYNASVTFNFVSGMPIPAGTVFKSGDLTLKGDDGDIFPKELKARDTLTYGDYVYSYGFKPTRSEFIDGQWFIHVANENKTEYDSPLPFAVIAGKPVSFANCFENCYSLEDASNIVIPEGITDMGNCFDSCQSMTKAPSIPSTVTNMYRCFVSCGELQTAPVIPESVKNIKECFASCDSLSGDVVINANPDDFENCFGRSACINLTGTSSKLVDIAKAVQGESITVNGQPVE